MNKKAIDFVPKKSNKPKSLGKSFPAPKQPQKPNQKKSIFISTDSSIPTESTISSNPAKTSEKRPLNSPVSPSKPIKTKSPTPPKKSNLPPKNPQSTPLSPLKNPLKKPSVSISHKITRSGNVFMAKPSATKTTYVDTPTMKLPSSTLHISYSDPLYDKQQAELRSNRLSPLKSFRNSRNIKRTKQDNNKSKTSQEKPKSPFLTSVVVEKRPLGDDIPVKNIYEPKLPLESELPPTPPVQPKIYKTKEEKPFIPLKKLKKIEKAEKEPKISKTPNKSSDSSSEPKLSIGIIIFLTVLIGIATAISVYFLLSK